MYKISIFISFLIVFVSCDGTKKNLSCHSNLPSSPLQGLVKKEGVAYKSSNNSTKNMALIQGGNFMMGASDTKQALPRELPRHKVVVNSFYMDVHEVTNDQFAKFVKETGYKTVAERDVDWEELKKQVPEGTPKPADSLLLAGSVVFSPPKGKVSLDDYSQWWVWKTGANWKHPLGPQSDIKGKGNFPVVHIAYEDAKAYASWAGKRLPTEAEWEYAARGGLEDKTYPWGNEHISKGKAKLNYWTGDFPYKNTEEDGFYLAAPVMSFEPNAYGLYDMAGNVWEICEDWYDDNYYKSLPQLSHNPKGPAKSYDSQNPYQIARVIRGGSFLCNDSYCSSYRVSARMPIAYDSGLNHAGFRCVKDIKN